MAGNEYTDHLAHAQFTRVKLTPRQRPRAGRSVGGLAEPEAFPDFARYRVDGKVSDIAPEHFSSAPLHLQGTYIYGGFLMKHFGHLMAECVHRLWIASKEEYRDLPVLFTAPAQGSGMEQLLEGLRTHFSTGEIRVLREDALVDELIIAETGKQFRRPSLPAYRRWLSEHINLADYRRSDLPEKLCILRGHLPHGKLIGERVIEQWLIDEGYHSLRPEEHDLQTQLAYVCSAKQIVFSEGSAMHLLDLLPPIQASIAIIRRRPTTLLAQTTLKGKVEDAHMYYRVTRALHFEATAGGQFSKALSYVSLTDLANFLVERGFLKEQPQQADHTVFLQDLRSYYAAVIAREDGDAEAPETMSGRALERLLDEQLEQFERAAETRYELFLHQADRAMAAGDYAAACSSAEQALRLYPLSDAASTLHAMASQKQLDTASSTGKLLDRLRRSWSVLTSSARVEDLTAPSAFFKRKL